MSAVPAPEHGPDAGAVWHYGDPFGEQRAAADAVVLVDRSHRAALQLTGVDRHSWLHTHLHAARQRTSRRGGHRESDPRRPGSCRGSLDSDAARRCHGAGHRALAGRAVAGVSAQDDLPGRRRRRSRRTGGAVAARPAVATTPPCAGSSAWTNYPPCGVRFRWAEMVSCVGPPTRTSTSWCRAMPLPTGGHGCSRQASDPQGCGPRRRAGWPP